MLKIKKIAITYGIWCGIGFKRGIDNYNYDVDRINSYRKDGNKIQYLYINALGMGMCGLCIYANLLTFPFTIYKELYRLEVNTKDLVDEKVKSYYNNLDFFNNDN
jgi:hypothetical protein